MLRGLGKMLAAHRKLLGIGLPVLAIVLALIYIVRLLGSPAVGTVDSTPFVADSTPSKTASTPSTTITGGYASFRYPSGYSLAPQATKSTGILDYYVLPRHNADIGGATQFGITIKRLDGAYSNDSGYRYRQQHPDLYSLSHEQLGATQLAVFTSKDQATYEKTLYWPHGNLLAIIALTANFNDPSFDKDFSELLHSWQWK